MEHGVRLKMASRGNTTNANTTESEIQTRPTQISKWLANRDTKALHDSRKRGGYRTGKEQKLLVENQTSELDSRERYELEAGKGKQVLEEDESSDSDTEGGVKLPPHIDREY